MNKNSSGTCGSTAINLATLDYGAFVKNTGKEVSLQVGKDIAEQETKSLAEQFAKECIVGQKDDKDTNSRLALLLGGVEVEAECVKPIVQDQKLENLVKDLYKGADTPNVIGTGSTADAVRNELKTGSPTYGKFHSDKAKQYINALNSWIKKTPNALQADIDAANLLKQDLQNALDGN